MSIDARAILTMIYNDLETHTQGRDSYGDPAQLNQESRIAYERFNGGASALTGIITQINNAGGIAGMPVYPSF